MSAALAGPRSWAESGHVVARAQFALQRAAPQRRLAAGAVSVRPGGFEVAAGDFDVRGRLTRLGGIPVLSAGLSVWRAPTENDRAPHKHADQSMEHRWREAGLERLVERTRQVVVLPAEGVGELLEVVAGPVRSRRDR